MLLLTTRGGARYRKLPEGTITPLRQAQQTKTEAQREALSEALSEARSEARCERTQPAPPLHTRHVLQAGRRETACGLVARGQQSRCRGVGWGRWSGLISKGVPTVGR